MATHRSTGEEHGLRQLRSFFKLPDELDTIFGRIDFEAVWCVPSVLSWDYTKSGIWVFDIRDLRNDPSTTNMKGYILAQNDRTGAWYQSARLR